MPTKKPTDNKNDDWKQHIEPLGKEVKSHLQSLKNKYESLNDDQKKALFAGLAGVAALLAGKHAVKKHKKKVAKKKKAAAKKK